MGGEGGWGEGGSGGPPLNSEFPDVINIILCIYVCVEDPLPEMRFEAAGSIRRLTPHTRYMTLYLWTCTVVAREYFHSITLPPPHRDKKSLDIM
jgi:hypothetical protein